MENQELVSTSRQCSSTPAALVKDLLAKNSVTTMQHPQQYPGLVLADLNLFSRLKSALTGRGFCDATDFIKNATEELKRLSYNCLQELFQRLYSRWQKCTVAQGDYVEGNVA
jgi:hypothetical protein